MSEQSQVFFHKGSDEQILAASARARESFRHFWYQIALDYNRIVPALELACLKVPFSDDFSDPDSQVEHMWVDQIYFDGEDVHGQLVNSPNWLKSVNEGDQVDFPLDQIGDWFCVLGGVVYGAYTVQELRARMAEAERSSHDAAWGLDFGDPATVLIPERNEKFENVIVDLIAKQIAGDSSVATAIYDGGMTPLHQEALFGRPLSVKLLLDHGASAEVKCGRGWTALDYAKRLNWSDVIATLTS